MKCYRHIAAGALAAVAFFGSASAGVIFDNGLPGLATVGFSSGTNVELTVAADNFALAKPARLTGAHFWTEEGLNPDGHSPWDGTLTWYIFADNGGSPAAMPLESGSGVDIKKFLTGRTDPGDDTTVEFEYDFKLDKPVDLASGTTYWFGLHLASDFDFQSIFWEGLGPSSGGDGKFARGGNFDDWEDSTFEQAFFLNGDTLATVPEPGTLALLGAGLFGVRRFTRRKKV